MIDISLDEPLKIMRCVSSGTISVAEAEAFNRKATLLHDRARARWGRCLILVDAWNSVVQTREVAAVFADQSAHRFRPGDRTAVITQSAVTKLQSQRMTDREATAYFTREADAVAWLIAEPQSTPA